MSIPLIKPNYAPNQFQPEAPQQQMYLQNNNTGYQQQYPPSQPQQYNMYQNQAKPKTTNKTKKPIHTAFFSNIQFTTPLDTFKNFVSQYGEIANMYSLIDKKGIAFVTYYDIRNAIRAVEEANDKTLNRRVIHTNFADKANFPHQDPRQTCSTLILYSSEIPSKVQVQDVNLAMKQFGEIQQVLIGGAPGQFVVKYYDIRDAYKAYNINNQRINIKDEIMTIDYLLDDDNETQPPPPPPINNQGYYNQQYIPPANYGQPYQPQSNQNYQMQGQPYGSSPPPPPNYGAPPPPPGPSTMNQGIQQPPPPNYGAPPQYQQQIPGQPPQQQPGAAYPQQQPAVDKAESLKKLKMLIKRSK